MKQILLLMTALMLFSCSSDGDIQAQDTAATGKTLVVYFTSSGNCREIAQTVQTHLPLSDMAQIQTVRETSDSEYTANGYKLGNDLLEKINADPENSDSYPAIKSLEKSVEDYDNIIFVTPLWHSQMAAPAQTFLFQNRSSLAGKHFGMIVSSWSSGIGTVVANAHRLVPEVVWLGEPLWINHSTHSRRESLVNEWLQTLNFDLSDTDMKDKIFLTIGNKTLAATLADNTSSRALLATLKEAPITYVAHDYGNFEKVGELGQTFPRNDEEITTEPGDIILYLGSSLCIYYDTNTWSFTRIGKIEGATQQQIKDFVNAGRGDVSVTLTAHNPTGIKQAEAHTKSVGEYVSPQGIRSNHPHKGVNITEGKKKLF